LDSGAVAQRPRAVATLGPAAVAIHDDGQMARHAGGRGRGCRHRGDLAQTANSSCSLAFTTSSMSLTDLSVIFWISSSLRRASSSVAVFSLSISLTCWM